MNRISKHISFNEATASYTAKRKGIDNTPDSYHISNMEVLAEKIFEPLREWVEGPIKINSMFRSKGLNDAIKGSRTSQHMEGRAMDIDDTYGHKTNAEMYNYIKENLDFDQLIWEFGSDENPDWVHVSYVSEHENRGKCLKAYREDGKTKYMHI